MLVAGTIVAGLLARETQNRAFLACVPPAFSVLGGAFVHVTEIAVAVPATILMLGYAKGMWRTVAVLALLLLAVPWRIVVSPAGVLVPIFPVGYLAWRYSNGSFRTALWAVLAAEVLFLGVDSAYVSAAGHHHAVLTGSPIDSSLPEASWGQFTRTSWAPNMGSWLVRIPTWTGQLLLVAALTSGAIASRLLVRVSPQRDAT